MNVLFAGLGSIGCRHLKNLNALCVRKGISLDVTALRFTGKALSEDVRSLVDKEVRTLPENERYDIAFITVPTHLHALVLEGLRDKVDCFFIEKPIFEAASYAPELLGLSPEQKAYVAAPMRHTALFAALKKRLQNTRVYSARAICSSYLPQWRPQQDYRENYSAHRAMGGGVALDLIHEWDYIIDLFGFPTQCAALQANVSHLEIDSEDISLYIARYPQLLCEVHLDYFGRTYRRILELFCEDGTIVANFGKNTLYLLNEDGTTTETYEEEPNRRYEREMEWFLEYAQGAHAQSLNSPAHAVEVLKVALCQMEDADTCQSK